MMTMTEQVKFETRLPLGEVFNDGHLFAFALLMTGWYYPETHRIIIDTAICFDEQGGMPGALLTALEALEQGGGILFPARDSGCAALQYARTAESFAARTAETLGDLASEHGFNWKEA